MESTRLSCSNAMLPNSIHRTPPTLRISFASNKRISNNHRLAIHWFTHDAEDQIFRIKASASKSSSNPTPEVSESNTSLKNLAGSLLFNAASLLNGNRKTAHCITCQGSGIVECAACQGAGILAPEKVAKMNTMKHAVHKVSQIFSKDSSTSMYDQDWIKTNRCKR
ncbi:hypothetical protein Ndes2526B_g03758 [Nannochloris sp. 'desiccata']